MRLQFIVSIKKNRSKCSVERLRYLESAKLFDFKIKGPSHAHLHNFVFKENIYYEFLLSKQPIKHFPLKYRKS
jgi:hypothetical protein